MAALVKCFEGRDFGCDVRLRRTRHRIASGTLGVEVPFSTGHVHCPCLLLRVVPTLEMAVAGTHGLHGMLQESHGGRRASV